jgi:hypothetical protein
MKTVTVRTALACFALAAILPAAWAVDPAPLPKEIRTAKTVFVLNQGIEPGTKGVVYDEIRKWSHCTLTDEHENADLMIVLSAQSYFAGMSDFVETALRRASQSRSCKNQAI